MNTVFLAFVSLGCPKAGADAEKMFQFLQAKGYVFTEDFSRASAVLINTCAFVEDAIEESCLAIEEALKENPNVVVTGCLGAKKDFLLKKFPHLLGITAPNQNEAVLKILTTHFPLPTPSEEKPHLLLTPPHFAYLKIAEGCNQQCSFCVIPQLRGKLCSRPLGEIMQEAESWVENGVKEIIVVAQDTAAYGVDKRYQTGFWGGKPLKSNIVELCKALSTLGVWVRLHYVYPYPMVDSLVELMKEGKILPYLDVPLQHANANILKAMQRPAMAENMLKRIQNWRSICPDIALRSTFIVGFPGETERDFEDLLDFLEEAQLNRAGVFAYSAVEGAPANLLKNPVSESVKMQRKWWFMETQGEISKKLLAQSVDWEGEVLVDAVDEEGFIARRKYDAPDVDGVVYIPHSEKNQNVSVGDFVRVRVVDSDTNDLYATLI